MYCYRLKLPIHSTVVYVFKRPGQGFFGGYNGKGSDSEFQRRPLSPKLHAKKPRATWLLGYFY